MRLGVDLMGGENPPEELFQAVLEAVAEGDPFDELVVLATVDVIDICQTMAAKSSFLPSGKIRYHEVSEVVGMHESPLTAVRRKKDSSLVTGIRLIRDRQLEGLVSSGNTGALIASATILLPLLPGIDRVALLASLPTKRGQVAVLDVGGHISIKAEHLVQFAHMGAAFQQCQKGKGRPTIGLLNIGVESLKGRSEVRQAYQLLTEQSCEWMTFVGNIEGGEVFDGKVDVLVTDGFSGNVFLKTAEGTSAFLIRFIQQTLESHMTPSLSRSLTRVEQQFNYEEYPGAIVCGVDGVVVKCHGSSTARGMLNAIRGAFSLIRNDLLNKIKKQMSK